MNLAWGKMIRHADIKLWFLNDPRVQSALSEVIESETLPLLRSVNTLDDFVAVADDPELWGRIRTSAERLAVDIARGKLDSARKLAAQFARQRDASPGFYPPEAISCVLPPLVEANDWQGLVKLLHEWEAVMVRQLRIEQIWEPTPFPIETMPGIIGESE